jgi:hypothetical protein
MSLNISEQEKEIISRLVSNDLISQQQIDSSIENYNNELNKTKKSFFKKFYYVDYEKLFNIR